MLGAQVPLFWDLGFISGRISLSLPTPYTEGSPPSGRANLSYVSPLAQSRGLPLRHSRARGPARCPLRPAPLASHRHPCHHRRRPLSLRLALRDAQRRPPRPARRHARDPDAPQPSPRRSVSAFLLALQNRRPRRLYPAHLLPPRPDPRIPSRPGDHGLPLPPQPLDPPPHRASPGRVRRTLPLAHRLAPLPDSRAPAQAKIPHPPLAPARNPPRSLRPDCPQGPPLRPALHDCRPPHRLAHRPGHRRRLLLPRPQNPPCLRHVAGLHCHDLHPPLGRSAWPPRR